MGVWGDQTVWCYPQALTIERHFQLDFWFIKAHLNYFIFPSIQDQFYPPMSSQSCGISWKQHLPALFTGCFLWSTYYASIKSLYVPHLILTIMQHIHMEREPRGLITTAQGYSQRQTRISLSSFLLVNFLVAVIKHPKKSNFRVGDHSLS